MPKTIDEILAAADWDVLAPRLLAYADRLLCAAKWRGASLVGGPDVSPCADGASAEDAVNEAIDRFLKGVREYQFSVTLEQNLRGAIRSIVWSWNKSSIREPVVELISIADEEGSEQDPFQEAADPRTTGECQVYRDDRLAHQEQALDAFRLSIANDKELATVFDLYVREIYTPQRIEEASKIPAARASELKRKLRIHMNNFINKNPAAAAALAK